MWTASLLNQCLSSCRKRLLTTPSEDADVHLRFILDDEDNYAVIVPAKGRVGVASVRRGSGTVLKVVDDKHVRVLWSHKDSQKTFLERRPSTNFGREFVKLYRRFN